MRLTILLTTRGARSGRPRPAELYAWPDADRLVIVGSSGGSARHPAWVHNLRARPRATVQRGKEVVEMTAREVTDPKERERLWPFVVEEFPLYATYQRRTKRLIPLFVLEEPPVGGRWPPAAASLPDSNHGHSRQGGGRIRGR